MFAFLFSYLVDYVLLNCFTFPGAA